MRVYWRDSKRCVRRLAFEIGVLDTWLYSITCSLKCAYKKEKLPWIYFCWQLCFEYKVWLEWFYFWEQDVHGKCWVCSFIPWHCCYTADQIRSLPSRRISCISHKDRHVLDQWQCKVIGANLQIYTGSCGNTCKKLNDLMTS